jgi:hypothetical protein
MIPTSTGHTTLMIIELVVKVYPSKNAAVNVIEVKSLITDVSASTVWQATVFAGREQPVWVIPVTKVAIMLTIGQPL